MQIDKDDAAESERAQKVPKEEPKGTEKAKRAQSSRKKAAKSAEKDVSAKKGSEWKAKLLSAGSEEPSLSECMLRLLRSPAADSEEAEKLLQCGICKEEISQTMLLAQAVLTKAVEKGDVSAYREVKALIDTENEGNGQFERLLGGICDAVLFEQGETEEKGPD